MTWICDHAASDQGDWIIMKKIEGDHLINYNCFPWLHNNDDVDDVMVRLLNVISLLGLDHVDDFVSNDIRKKEITR